MPRLLLVVLLVVMPAVLPAQSRHMRLIARIDSIVRRAMEDQSIPGLSIGVSRGKEIILAKGYGYAVLEDSTPATDDTVYPIASITKQFTAAAIMQLDEADQVRLTEDFSAYLPEFRGSGPKITIQRLLNHTAGIPDRFPGDSTSPGALALDHSPAEFRAAFTRPTTGKPGETFQYSNAGYYLLGLVIEAVSGEPYGEYVRKHLFTPAGMVTSSVCGSPAGPAARGYERDDSTAVPAPEIRKGTLYAAAGLCSTVRDLLAWQRALTDRKVVNFFSWKQMIEPARLEDDSRASYGFGLVLGRLEKHAVMGHGGSVPGFSSQLSWYPDDELAVAVLANSGTAIPRRIADQIAIAVLGIMQPEVKNLSLSEDELTRYTGSFDLSGNDLEVYVEAGRLMMRIGNEGDGIGLLYQGSNEFATEPDPSTRLYFRLSRGRARSVLFTAGDLSLTAQRK